MPALHPVALGPQAHLGVRTIVPLRKGEGRRINVEAAAWPRLLFGCGLPMSCPYRDLYCR